MKAQQWGLSMLETVYFDVVGLQLATPCPKKRTMKTVNSNIPPEKDSVILVASAACMSCENFNRLDRSRLCVKCRKY
jgi:hypothetical protein